MMVGTRRLDFVPSSQISSNEAGARAEGAALFRAVDMENHRSIAIPKSAQILLTNCARTSG
jgi:hypothetical protein